MIFTKIIRGFISAAYIINAVLYSLCIFLAALLYVFHEGSQSVSMQINYLDYLALIICILIPSIPFITAQWIMMSKTGQSFGKRIMKIKVINLDGRNPGFVGTVLIREILFQTIIIIFSYLLIEIFNLNPESTEKIFNYLITFICFFMLFRTEANRRTLQDYLAKTIVIKK
ncbi:MULTISPECIES: RDD family protein [unclassified Snodgrassella]|uniref:RDD family protein n=1 Tax=unclassified Snodgrassella TaxID=2625236 RepID=UPI0018DBE00D|nr:MULTISPECIES: RDD family protein [unclassified Snodgrassella]MBI0067731.1 RDD family protein [Snodgrassella sp. M0110]MBI0076730.1 RDD family protein [Snodgrassella sp. M0118]MBI0079031.1 RDD family protein [Snodgrassella sp. M0112]